MNCWGSGYNAQNAKPVHIGHTETILVEVEVTTMSGNGSQSTRFVGIDPQALCEKPFVTRVAGNSRLKSLPQDR